MSAIASIAALKPGTAGTGAPGFRPPGLSKCYIPPRKTSSVASVEMFRGAGFIAVRLPPVYRIEPPDAPSKRGEITSFSDGSRRRMMDVLAKIQWDAIPFWADLTYPDEFPTDSEIWKAHLEAFLKRLQRRFPAVCVLWKLELQTRKSGTNAGKLAPHFHLMVWNVPWDFEIRAEHASNCRVVRHAAGDSPCWRTEILSRAGEIIGGDLLVVDSIRSWTARNWFSVVDSNDGKHWLAGTSVTLLKTRSGAFSYASKRYVAKREQVEAFGLRPGRFWGIFGRRFLPLGQRQCVRVSGQQAIQLRRFIRRHRRANTKPENRRWLRKGSASDAEKGFTVKHYCNADFWLAALPRLIGPALPPRSRIQIPPLPASTELKQHEFL